MFRLKKQQLFFPIAAILATAGVVFFVSYGSSQVTNRAVLDISLSSDNYESSTRTFSDRSGLGNDGVSSNSVIFADGKYGSVDGAMSFDGVSDFIKINNVIVSNPNALTISAWFKKESGGSTYECVLHQNSGYTIGSSAYWLGVDDADYLTATIGANTGVGWAAGQTDIKAIYGEWYHLLATWDGSVVKVFVNGEYVKQYSLTSYTNQTSPTRIGASADSGTNYWFSGEIEGVKILNYSLSDEEVRNLYDSGRSVAGLSSVASGGLVGYWSMDASDYNSANSRVTDKSSFENHGINSGATFTTDRFGKEGGAMSFDGTKYIKINHNNILKPSDSITISSWVYIPQLDGQHRWIVRTGWGGAPYFFGKNIYDKFVLVINDQSVMYNSTTAPSANVGWNYVAGTYDGSNVKVYLNGVLQWTYSYTSTINTNTLPIFIGGGDTNNDGIADAQMFNGIIDELRVYNRALSESEIQSLYNSYNPKTTTGTLQKGLILDMPLKLKYTKDETPGSEIMTDRTPYSNDGQNYGATITSDGGSFNNSSHQRILGNIDSPDSGLTLSAWINPTAYPSERSTIIQGISPASYYLSLYNNGAINTYWYGTNPAGYHSSSAGDVSLNVWTHVVGMWNGSQAKIYVNGDNKKTISVPGLGTTPASFNIGAESISRQFVGQISNVLIYNRALSDDEVKMLYDRGRSDSGIIFTPEN